MKCVKYEFLCVVNTNKMQYYLTFRFLNDKQFRNTQDKKT